ncbi:MAG TPA: hypothetical protein VEV17_14765 [Bryobacteraceae bacterium]|nr:hypothetical protein [Bryobacteraceae bacterium]
MSYILSNDNRFYVALEPTYGNAASAAATNRISAVKLTARQRTEKVQRKDKTGSRTFAGNPSGLRKETTFELRTYMTNWADQTTPPAHAPLFQACLGGAATLSPGGTIAAGTDPGKLAFTLPHGLMPGRAVISGSEIRFASAIIDDHTVQLNAPFTVSPAANSQSGPTAAFQPATTLGSVTIFDYWSPATSVQRILSGAAVDSLTLAVNGDFHEFIFSGPARDLVDSSSFQSGQCGLTAFPPEPAVTANTYAIIPGHLGQVWLGSTPNQFFTLTKAQIRFQNNLDVRAHEFGSDLPMAISPGQRTVTADFSLYQMDDAATAALYQAARQRSPISILIQLGQQPGQLFGVYMKSVVPEVPEFDDSDKRQQWQFQTCRAQGSANDEIFVAFG